MPRYRCLICDDVVYADHRHDHLIEHAPAYGSTGSPAITATLFIAVADVDDEADEPGPPS